MSADVATVVIAALVGAAAGGVVSVVLTARPTLTFAPIAVGGMILVAVLAIDLALLPAGATRDLLASLVVGAMATLVATLVAQELQTRNERRRRQEDDAREEIRISGAIARELATASAYLTAFAAPGLPSEGQATLLPHRAWDLYGVELGRYWHPHSVSDVALVYHELNGMNGVLRQLGAPADGTTSTTARPIPDEVRDHLLPVRDRIDEAVARFNRRSDALQRRFRWSPRPRPDDEDF